MKRFTVIALMFKFNVTASAYHSIFCFEETTYTPLADNLSNEDVTDNIEQIDIFHTNS